jgi:hypothetical protein
VRFVSGKKIFFKKPEPTTLETKLWGTVDDLRRTATFVQRHGWKIYRTQKKKKKQNIRVSNGNAREMSRLFTETVCMDFDQPILALEQLLRTL